MGGWTDDDWLAYNIQLQLTMTQVQQNIYCLALNIEFQMWMFCLYQSLPQQQ